MSEKMPTLRLLRIREWVHYFPWIHVKCVIYCVLHVLNKHTKFEISHRRNFREIQLLVLNISAMSTPLWLGILMTWNVVKVIETESDIYEWVKLNKHYHHASLINTDDTYTVNCVILIASKKIWMLKFWTWPQPATQTTA